MNYDPNPNNRPGETPVLCWGHPKAPKQWGIVSYGLSANRQRPLAGALHNAVFNTSRRVWGQVFYVAPPFIVAYLLMEWMEKKNKYLNSKQGRMEAALPKEYN